VSWQQDVAVLVVAFAFFGSGAVPNGHLNALHVAWQQLSSVKIKEFEAPPPVSQGFATLR
jgi:hypothetical protein